MKEVVYAWKNPFSALAMTRLHTPGTVLVFFDTETTGTNPEADYPTEVAAVKVRVRDDLSMEILDRMTEYIRPPVQLSAELENLTGITNAFLADKPEWSEVHAKIRDFFGNHTVVAHNAPFDTGFMKKMYALMGDTFEPDGVIDTLALARACMPGHPHNLRSCVEILKVEKEVKELCETAGYHDASFDVMATICIYRKLIPMSHEIAPSGYRVPRILAAWYWGGYNHKQAAIFIRTDLGTVYFTCYSKEWRSKEIDLSVIDMPRFEELAWRYCGAKTEKEFCQFRKMA